MNNKYIYQKPIVRNKRSKWVGRVKFALALVLIGGLAYGVWLFLGDSNHVSSPATSKLETQTVSEGVSGLNTTTNDYFQFQDIGKWVLQPNESGPGKFVYYKYRGNILEHQLTVYINQVPIPLYLASSYSVPVRISNENSFDVTSVNGPCGKNYPAGALHKVMTISMSGGEMLCDPDTPLHTVVFSQIGGSYQIKLKRKDNSYANYLILYRDQRPNPNDDVITRIAGSFKSL